MISVCMATHNGEQYIQEQIESILKQLSEGDELVISDDGSTDRTISIIMSIDDSRIKLFRYYQPNQATHSHEYVCKNFENAIKHAVGDVIFLSDQDDIWMDGKVKEILSLLDKCLLVVHDMQCVDGAMNKIDGGYHGKFHFHNWIQKSPTYFGCVMAFRKELIPIILPFPSKLMVHDFWIGILAELKGGVYFLDKKLIIYRIHNNNTSTYVTNTLVFKLRYRLYTIYEVLKRHIKTINKLKSY